MWEPTLAKNLRHAISTVFYDGRVVPRHTEYEHFYEDTVDGEVYASVTAKTGILDKVHLKQWAANKAIESLVEFIESNREYNEFEFAKAVQEAKNAHKYHLNRAADWGTVAHNLVDDYVSIWIDTGVRPKSIAKMAPEDIEPESLSAALGAEKFFNEYTCFPVVSEKKVVSKKYGYAGTLDGLYLIGEVYKDRHGDKKCEHIWWEKGETKIWCEKCGRTEELVLTLLDLKTSNQIMDKRDYGWQVACYGMTLTEMVGIKPKQYWILQILKNKPDYVIGVVSRPKDMYKEFLIANEIHKRINDGGETVVPLKKKNRIKL
jgi:hypothetical protein